MPHIVTFVQPQRVPAQMGELRSDHLGAFKALNESTSIVHPAFRTGLISPDQMRPVDSLSETFGDGDPRILGPISGEGIFKPQDIDAKGSVVCGDNHFKPGADGDSTVGDGRRMNIWGNVGASTFEDRMTLDFDGNDFHACPNKIHLDPEAPSMSMHQGAMNSVWVKDLAGNFLDAAANMTETFEPMAAMTSFSGSSEDVLGQQSNWDVICDVGKAARQSAVMPSVAIVYNNNG